MTEAAGGEAPGAPLDPVLLAEVASWTVGYIDQEVMTGPGWETHTDIRWQVSMLAGMRAATAEALEHPLPADEAALSKGEALRLAQQPPEELLMYSQASRINSEIALARLQQRSPQVTFRTDEVPIATIQRILGSYMNEGWKVIVSRSTISSGEKITAEFC